MHGDSCKNNAATCPGIRVVSRCVVKSNTRTLDSEGSCSNVETKRVKMVGSRLDALAAVPVQCPAGEALVGWKAKADDRPWYVRKKQQGQYSFLAKCCSALELDVCRDVKHGCELRTNYGVEAFVAEYPNDWYPRAECHEHDEVMTSWTLTGEGCPAGHLQVKTKCCATPTYFSATTINAKTEASREAAALTSVNPNDKDAAEKIQEKVNDFKKGDETRTGPLIDAMMIQEGASYVPRDVSYAGGDAALAGAGKSWAKEAFDAVRMNPSDANVRRFCTHEEVEFANDWSPLLKPCNMDQGVGRVPEGNVFLRVSTKLGVGFGGKWMFRAETHGFTGALVVEQHGGGVIASHDVVRHNGKMNAATAEIFLAPGTYVVSVYAAYDEAGGRGALAHQDFRDSLLFIQESHCDKISWHVLDQDALASCGGNEVRPEDQPGGDSWPGGFVKRSPVKEVSDSAHGGGAGDEAVPESAYNASLIDGESLKNGEKKVEDSELTGLNAFKTFDGAFISMKIVLPLDPAGPKDKKAKKDKDGKEIKKKRHASASDAPPSPSKPPSASDYSGTEQATAAGKKFLSGDNYIIVNARIIVLYFMVEIDVRIVSGPAEEGGGVHMNFVFEWKVGNQELAFLNATLDMQPFDFSVDAATKLATKVMNAKEDLNKTGTSWVKTKAVLDEVYIYIGIEIRPTILNLAVGFFEPVLRIGFILMMTPLVVAVTIAQQVLNLAIKAVEAVRRDVKAAEKALSELERWAMNYINGAKQAYMKYERMESASRMARRLSDANCRQMFKQTSSQGCVIVNGVEDCTIMPLQGKELPENCGQLVAHYKLMAATWAKKCCTFWINIKRIFLKAIYFTAKRIVQALIALPRLFLKIVNALLLVVELALKMARMALNAALCVVLAFVGAWDKILDEDNNLIPAKFISWAARVELIRVNELKVAAKFEQSSLSMEARLSIVLFSRHLDLGFSFSLNFLQIVAGFGELLKELFNSLLQLFSGVGECVTRLVKQFVEGTDFSLAGLGEPSDAYRAFHSKHVAFLGPRAAATQPDDHRKVGGDVDDDGDDAALGAASNGYGTINHLGHAAPIIENDLGLAIRREHTFYAQAVAAAFEATSATAALQATNLGGDSAAAGAERRLERETHHRAAHARAAHVLGARVVSAGAGAVHVAPEWSEACVAKKANLVDASSSPCAAVAFAAAVSCGAAQEHAARRDRTTFGSDVHPEDAAAFAAKHEAKYARSRAACALSLNTLSSETCVAERASQPHLASCAAKLNSALPCSDRCSEAMASMADDCRGFVPRAEQASSNDVFHTAACQSTLLRAQSTCGGGGGSINSDNEKDRFCAELLEPAPGAATREHANHPIKHRTFFWSDQHALGVVPKQLCESTGGHIDVRGNRLVGSVPDCVWAQKNGASHVHLSRNMLTGTMGAVGAHVKNLYVNDNRLHGDLHAALGGAHALEHLEASDNSFTGTLGFIAGKSSVMHVGVADNGKLTDSLDAPVVESVLSKLGALRSYGISGNAFHPATPAPSTPRSLHIVLRLKNDISQFCPSMAPGDALQWNCGDMLASVPKVDQSSGAMTSEFDGSLLAAVDCAVQAAVERAGPATTTKMTGGGDDTSSFSYVSEVRRERIFPFKAPDRRAQVTFVSYTVNLNEDVQPDVVSALKRSLTSRNGLHAVAATLGSLSSSEDGGGSCGAKTAFLRKIEVEQAEVRGGCPPGLMGPTCSYACMTRWSRVDDGLHSHDLNKSANERGADADTERRAAFSSSSVSERVEIEEEDDDQQQQKQKLAPYVGGHGSAAGALGGGDLKRMVVHHWEGDDAEKHHMAANTETCVAVCRGHANRAIHFCSEWINGDKADKTARYTCAAMLGDMGEMCGLSRSLNKSCRGGHASYTPRAQQRDDHGCQVCGIYHYFHQHGAFGHGSAKYATHHVVGTLLRLHAYFLKP